MNNMAIAKVIITTIGNTNTVDVKRFSDVKNATTFIRVAVSKLGEMDKAHVVVEINNGKTLYANAFKRECDEIVNNLYLPIALELQRANETIANDKRLATR